MMAIFGCGASVSDISAVPVCRRYQHLAMAQSNDQNGVERDGEPEQKSAERTDDQSEAEPTQPVAERALLARGNGAPKSLIWRKAASCRSCRIGQGQDSSVWSAGFASAPLTERETAAAKGALLRPLSNAAARAPIAWLKISRLVTFC